MESGRGSPLGPLGYFVWTGLFLYTFLQSRFMGFYEPAHAVQSLRRKADRKAVVGSWTHLRSRFSAASVAHAHTASIDTAAFTVATALSTATKGAVAGVAANTFKANAISTSAPHALALSRAARRAGVVEFGALLSARREDVAGKTRGVDHAVQHGGGRAEVAAGHLFSRLCAQAQEDEEVTRLTVVGQQLRKF